MTINANWCVILCVFVEPWHNPSYFGLKTLKCVGVFFPAPLPRKIHEESFKCAKYLRAILVITYLFFYGYDCSDSTLTNMNEWIHEETRVMCYITHQKGKVLLRYKKKDCISSTLFRGTRDLFSGMKHESLHFCERKKITALSQRWGLISVSTNSSVFWLSVCDTAKQHSFQLQNSCIHQNTLIGYEVKEHLLHLSPLSMSGF